jgi:uncharacterized protein YyaL (SSP411 family)
MDQGQNRMLAWLIRTTIVLVPACVAVGYGSAVEFGRTPVEMTQQEPPKHTNRLARETSPYLLQHAHNPVDWHPWGAEAIELARQADKPIFLSIGYSTCYWCHVMERESFEDEATAEVMNRDFVCIKVDREQRPDVDEIYMTSCQVFTRMTTGRASGGWPLSVFIDPASLKPYFVGTYFPPDAGGGRPSFTQVLEGMSNAWKTQHDAVVEQADRIASMVVASLAAGEVTRPLGTDQVSGAIDRLMASHDRTHGGFGGAPKFPQPVFLELLMEAGWDRPAVRDAIKHSLDEMAKGGINDHVGGGFHRYSTDEKWLVPHFEKMLYDNGQLASLYAESHARTGDPFHAAVLRRTLDYVLLEMTDARSGAFYSAQDAEVNRHEGENYLWTREQVVEVLESAGLEADVPLALKLFGLDLGTNFQDPHHPELAPNNVLFLSLRPEEFAEAEGMTGSEFDDFMGRIIPPLYAARMKRDQPGLDDKIIVGWNGLMIAGMADGGRVLEEPAYVEAAARSARFILDSMRDDDGGLLRTARNGEVAIPAFLEDYAFLARGLVALFDATGDQRWLAAAGEIVEAARSRFWGEDGAWYDTQADQADLFVRSRNLGDGAVPSGIGTMLLVLPALAERTGETWYLDDFQSAMSRLSGSFAANPVGSTCATIATSRALADHPDRLPSEAAPDLDRVQVSLVPEAPVFIDGRARVIVRLDVAEGFHINAHLPGDERLVGLRIELADAEGVSLEVDYPEGDLYRESIRVHARTVEIPVELTRTAGTGGSASLVVAWQACTDQVCHVPEALTVPIPMESTDP